MSGDDCYGGRSGRGPQSTDGGSTPDGGQLALGTVFRCLSSTRRRYSLYYLREHDVATVDELARHVAASVSGRSSDDIEAATLERITIALLHQHIPVLVDASIVDYDARSETVRYVASPPLGAFLTLAGEIELDGDEEKDKESPEG